MKLLAVRLNGDTWEVAHYNEEGAPDQEIMDNFGTHVLPSGMRAAMPLGDVLATLRQLNPDKVVTEGGEGNSFRVA